MKEKKDCVGVQKRLLELCNSGGDTEMKEMQKQARIKRKREEMENK